jgi:hypothetical protein
MLQFSRLEFVAQIRLHVAYLRLLLLLLILHSLVIQEELIIVPWFALADIDLVLNKLNIALSVSVIVTVIVSPLPESSDTIIDFTTEVVADRHSI